MSFTLIAGLASIGAVPPVLLSLCLLIIGILIGFLAAGNFVFVPLLIYGLRVATRIAIGSSLFGGLIGVRIWLSILEFKP